MCVRVCVCVFLLASLGLAHIIADTSRAHAITHAASPFAAHSSRKHTPDHGARANTHHAQVVHQISGIRGEVLPVFSVADGAELEPNFGGAAYAQGMPLGFQGIIKSMSLL